MKRFYYLLFALIFSIACSDHPSITEKDATNVYYDKAFEFRQKEEIDSAFKYFNKAKDIFLQTKDTFSIGKCIVNMAIISVKKGDYFGGEELSLNALSYLNTKNVKHYPFLHSNYNNLGIASHQLKDYSHALVFFDNAILFAQDSVDKRLYLNNKAKTYQQLKDYNEALKIYNLILKGTSKNRIEYARALANIAHTKWLQNPNYNALPDLLKSLHIRKKENDNWGLNSSYAHLADYYIPIQKDSALIYAQQMYRISQKLNSADDQLEALNKLIILGSGKEVIRYFEKYKTTEDSVQIAQSAAKNQFALIRYETEKSLADNLILQKDNDGKRYQIIILAFGIVLISVTGSFLYKRRKQKLERAAQDTIRDNKLKTSQKVHDVVANGLYRIMNKLDNQETLKDNPIINEIEDLYEQSRDLSYEKPKPKNLSFNEKISDILKSFASDRTRVLLVGNSAQLWEKVSEQAKDEIEHILQELMVNMDKHSRASDVVIRFEQEDRQINIYYIDNGIGISGKIQPNNGLTNTGIRIAAIGGTIIFDTKVERGLKIQITFPGL